MSLTKKLCDLRNIEIVEEVSQDEGSVELVQEQIVGRMSLPKSMKQIKEEDLVKQ